MKQLWISWVSLFFSFSVSRFNSFCCCQGRPGIPLHCCAHVRVSCWANMNTVFRVVTFVCFTAIAWSSCFGITIPYHHCTIVCVPVHPSYTLSSGHSLQSLLSQSFQIHTFRCLKGRNSWSLLSFSFACNFFKFSFVFTLLALLSVHSTCGQTVCHVFGVFVPTGSRFLSPELARSSLVWT